MICRGIRHIISITNWYLTADFLDISNHIVIYLSLNADEQMLAHNVHLTINVSIWISLPNTPTFQKSLI